MKRTFLAGAVILVTMPRAAPAEEPAAGKTETTVEVEAGKEPPREAPPAAEKPAQPGKTAPSAKPPQGKPAADAKPAGDAKAAPDAKPAADAKPGDAKPADAKPAADAAPAKDPAAEQAFNVKLRGIEERVNDLKEKIFQSKARLVQLQEAVLHGAISGARAVLVHRNEMGSSFRLKRVQYALDGAPIFNRADSGSGELNDQEEFEIFNGSIAPGNHQLAVYLEYQGYGYGVFSYLKGYTFKIKSSYTFDAEEGKLTTVRIVGFEKGGITTELKDRPSVEYKIERADAVRPAEGQAPAAGEAAPPP